MTVRVCMAMGYLVICVNGLVEAHQLLSTLVVIACTDMPQHEHISLTYCPCLMNNSSEDCVWNLIGSLTVQIVHVM